MNFSLDRFANLIKRDWLVYKKPLGYAFLAIAIFLIGVVVLNAKMEEDSLPISFWASTFGFFLIGGGFIATSIIYWEFRNPGGRIAYLSLPASNFEKTLSRLTYSVVLYPLCLLVLFFMVFKLTEVLDGATFYDVRLSPLVEIFVTSYLLAQPIVFLFSIWINKYVAPKTSIVALITFLVLAVVGSLIFRIIFREVFEGWEMSGQFKIEPKEGVQSKFIEDFFPRFRNCLILFSMVFFWTVSYFKMKEKEI